MRSMSLTLLALLAATSKGVHDEDAERRVSKFHGKVKGGTDAKDDCRSLCKGCTSKCQTFAPGDKVGIPKAADDTVFAVYYAETDIKGAEKLAATHSGITFKAQCGRRACQVWTMDLYADEGLYESLCPLIDPSNGLPYWNNDVVVGLADTTLNWDPDDAVRETYLGEIKGSVFNEFHNFVEKYLEKHPVYQVFDVMLGEDHRAGSNPTSRTIRSEVCDSFSEAAIEELYRLDSSRLLDRLDVKPELKRNYQILLSSSPQPVVVEPSDNVMKKFMQDFSYQCRQHQGDFAAIVPILGGLFQQSPVAFVVTTIWSPSTFGIDSQYHRIPLADGYMKFAYEPMLTSALMHGKGEECKSKVTTDIRNLQITDLKHLALDVLGLSRRYVRQHAPPGKHLGHKITWQNAVIAGSCKEEAMAMDLDHSPENAAAAPTGKKKRRRE